MEEDTNNAKSDSLLVRSFLSTARIKIDVYDGMLTMQFKGNVIKFNIYDAMKNFNVSPVCGFDVTDYLSLEVFKLIQNDKLNIILCRNINLESEEGRRNMAKAEIWETVCNMEYTKDHIYTGLPNDLPNQTPNRQHQSRKLRSLN